MGMYRRCQNVLHDADARWGALEAAGGWPLLGVFMRTRALGVARRKTLCMHSIYDSGVA